MPEPLPTNPGDIWIRRNGTRFKIDHVDLKYAYYWLAQGSKAQYRSVRLELLTKRYRKELTA
jgi:hypothetical protein